MSYLVLARKYRPRNFAEMAGQEHVVQALSNALTRQRLHHAYLFTGTRGVGKTTVARILAKALNCQGPDGQGGITAAPCGLCPACTDIDSGRFVDYTELDAASNRGVDEVQSLLEQAVYKPVQGRFKVFMIDEVHMLTNTAFNAMLKTLEEPPEYLKFVLATTDPQKVPVTVLSRCLQFNLRPMAPETVHAQLVQVLAAEQVPAEPQALRLLSRAARGSMRDALSLADQAIAFGNGQLQEAAVRQMLGAVDHAHVLELIDALARGDGRTVVETSDRLRRDGLSAASTLEDMAAVLQRMAVLQVAPPRSADTADTADTADAQDPEAAQTARLAALMPADETQLLYSLCLHGRGELGLAPDEYAALTMVLLRLLAFKPGGAAVVEKKNLTQPEAAPPDRAPGEGAAPLPPPPPVPPPAAPACAADSAGVPSPPGSDRPPRTQAAATALPVRSAEHFSSDGKPAQATRAALHAIPVRVMPEPESAPEPAPSRHSPTPEGDVWYAAVQQLVATRAIEALARELALQSQLVARDGAHWLLRVESESLISQPTARERLREALQAAGHASQISVELGAVADSPARRIAAAAAAARLRAEEIVASDPYVQSLMREHGAKIVPGSVRPE
ncbi:DNA polymerase III subunit gamma/tau [Verminephrobacter aporrectodeae subsp. tuberculatae]|uniref:DNA polymerase III subunit gamma/tau n=4 Tax=Verminephrobacter TaxID=364316 RepID=A0ABT3KVN4_9BURK|nr:DNA polymerase III subunit gamma/tau [Verminephrobacter aporrectodeae]MCW5322301.1 DNA polymerase III subunit gamma/tau [Verminephrobacter aporrectodeae subsp. tuberculatae]